jgi:hypothetical protein
MCITLTPRENVHSQGQGVNTLYCYEEQMVFTPRGQLLPWGSTSPTAVDFAPRGDNTKWSLFFNMRSSLPRGEL